MAGGDVDAGLAVVLAHGEAQLGGGTQALKQAHVDAVGGADLSGGTGEDVGFFYSDIRHPHHLQENESGFAAGYYRPVHPQGIFL